MLKEERKAIVKALEEKTGLKAKYLGPPTFAYQIGDYTVDRDGNVEGDQMPKKDEFIIKVPIDDFDVRQYLNLINMVYSKQKLLNASTDGSFYISENIIEVLRENKPEDVDYIKDFLERAGDEVKGISFEEDCVLFTGFNYSEGDEATACASVAAMMVSHARAGKTIHAKLTDTENEKYAMRIWLNQIGLSGKGGKDTREAMMRKLSGDCAFRTDESKQRWTEKRRKSCSE